MKIITLYEAGSTDGYTTQGEGAYFLHSYEAESYAKNKNGGHGRIIEHDNIAIIDGKYYMLKKSKPITLFNSIDLKERAMSKLTDEDKKVLGLI